MLTGPQELQQRGQLAARADKSNATYSTNNSELIIQRLMLCCLYVAVSTSVFYTQAGASSPFALQIQLKFNLLPVMWQAVNSACACINYHKLQSAIYRFFLCQFQFCCCCCCCCLPFAFNVQFNFNLHLTICQSSAVECDVVAVVVLETLGGKCQLQYSDFKKKRVTAFRQLNHSSF